MAITPKQPDGESPLTSKKFIAYLVAELTWKGIIVLMVLNLDKLGDRVNVLTVILIAGFLEVAYILGQAYVDRYLQIATMAFDKGKDAAKGVVTEVESLGGVNTETAVVVVPPVVVAPVQHIAAPIVAPEPEVAPIDEPDEPVPEPIAIPEPVAADPVPVVADPVIVPVEAPVPVVESPMTPVADATEPPKE